MKDTSLDKLDIDKSATISTLNCKLILDMHFAK